MVLCDMIRYRAIGAELAYGGVQLEQEGPVRVQLRRSGVVRRRRRRKRSIQFGRGSRAIVFDFGV
eukprot:2857324-Rhodomonas_salina.1